MQETDHLPTTGRAANGMDQVGGDLEGCRQYLLLVANRELRADLKAKLGASDLVQDTLLAAVGGLGQFRGSTHGQLLRWLRGILRKHLATCTRRYHGSEKRRVSAEVPIDESRLDWVGRQLVSRSDTPSRHAIRCEEADLLHRAMERLAPRDRQVIRLRHFQQLPFKEVADRLQLTEPAARNLWARAVRRLQRQLESRQGQVFQGGRE